MKKLSKRKKIFIWVGSIIIFIGLVITIGANVFVANLLRNKIESEFNQNPKIPYIIDVSGINIGLFRGSVKLTGISISPKPFAKDSLYTAKMKSLFTGKIDVIKLTNIRIFKFINEKKIKLNQIIIKGANIISFKNKDAESIDKSSEDSTGLNGKNLLKAFKSLDINKLKLEKINYTELDADKPLDTLISIKSLSFEVNDIAINEESVNNPIPFYFDDLIVGAKFFTVNKMKYYGIKTSGIEVKMADTVIVINDFGFIPKYSRKEYNRRLKYENDLFNIKTKKIILRGLSIEELINYENGLELSSVEIKKLNTDIYRDKNLPDPPYKYHPLLAGLIKKIPVTLTIDSVNITNGSLVYSEKQKLTDTPGEVSFKNMNLTIRNITNDTVKLSKDHIMPVDISAKLYGKGKIKARIEVDLTSGNEDFIARGSLGPMKATEFNKMTKELVLAQITSGDIKSAHFNFSADDDVSNGELIVRYDNLKIKMLKSKDTVKKAKFMSFIAGTALNSRNMPGDKKFRKGVIYFERVKGKALPNYLWKSVMSGLVSTIAPIATNKNQRQKSKAKKKEEKSKNKKSFWKLKK